MDINLFIDLELNRNKIIEDNYGLVISEVMKKFIHFPFDREDLIQRGLIGLIKAVDTYDVERNINFSTYAVKCIDNEIYSFIRSEQKQVNMLSYYNKKIFCLKIVIVNFF